MGSDLTMSELTRCNYCSLKLMERKAKVKDDVVVVVRGEGEWAGWTTARYSKEERPSAYFMELTDHCVC